MFNITTTHPGFVIISSVIISHTSKDNICPARDLYPLLQHACPCGIKNTELNASWPLVSRLLNGHGVTSAHSRTLLGFSELARSSLHQIWSQPPDLLYSSAFWDCKSHCPWKDKHHLNMKNETQLLFPNLKYLIKSCKLGSRVIYRGVILARLVSSRWKVL